MQPYDEQSSRWPARGRHILADFDEDTVVVYQAYGDAIASWALEHGRFGGPSFSFDRMSWIKPGFLWMMHRSQWATAEGQERVLAIRLQRSFFDEVLRRAVPTSHVRARYASRKDWQDALARAEVLVQWDPDHDPAGNKLERRAIQLGLRGEQLVRYAADAVVAIEDRTDLAHEQAAHRTPPFDRLFLPVERVYVPADEEAAHNVGLAPEEPVPAAPPTPEKKRFRTAREAFDWIKWDRSFDPSRFVVGYDEHAEDPAELSLEAFEGLGEIPLHRVLYLRAGREVVWDRRARLDRLAELRARIQHA
jgi:uncharacterized protein (UPF0248 family)